MVETQFVTVAPLAELQRQRRLLVTVGSWEVLLCMVAGEVVAVQNRCTHLGKPLDKGRIMAGQILCPYHGACFDLQSGEAVSGPAVSPLRRFETRIEEGQVLIALPA